jgi:anti-anti-sigma regulatory factor
MGLETMMAADSVIRLTGEFDGIAARRLEATLVAATGGERFDIDLTQVRGFHDFAIAVLGHALTRTRADVRIRGLRHHQIRVLRYFGVDAAPLQAAALSDAA